MKEKFKVEFKYGHQVINGEYYELKSKDGISYLKHTDKKKVEDRRKKCDKIAKKLKDNLDAHKVLLEATMKMTDKDINKLYNLLFHSKRKLTKKTRGHACVDMKVGNFIVPIVD